MSFILFIAALIAIRLAELLVANKNEKWARGRGAVEYGRAHYPFMVAMHSLFFVSLILEYYYAGYAVFHPVLFGLLVIVYAIKVWVIASLGRYWNTKILRVPGEQLVTKGPYKYVSHPNYIIVIVEIALIPMVFHLCITAILFSLLNAVMLTVRIREENRALAG